MLQGRRRNSDPLLVKSVAKRALFAHLNLLLAEPAAKSFLFLRTWTRPRGTGREEGPTFAHLDLPLTKRVAKKVSFCAESEQNR